MKRKSKFKHRLIIVALLLLAAYLGYTWLKFNLSMVDATVVDVIDGDTVDAEYPTILGQRTIRIRFASIDAPERGQPFWREARMFVSNRIAGLPIRIQKVGSDRYGRTLGWVYFVVNGEERELNSEIVSNGLAWWYQTFAPYDSKISALESQARQQAKGIWSISNPVSPWDYRSAR